MVPRLLDRSANYRTLALRDRLFLHRRRRPERPCPFRRAPPEQTRVDPNAMLDLLSRVQTARASLEVRLLEACWSTTSLFASLRVRYEEAVVDRFVIRLENPFELAVLATPAARQFELVTHNAIPASHSRGSRIGSEAVNGLGKAVVVTLLHLCLNLQRVRSIGKRINW